MADGERIHTFFLSPPTHRTRGWFLSTHSRVACSSVGRNNVMLCYVMTSFLRSMCTSSESMLGSKSIFNSVHLRWSSGKAAALRLASSSVAEASYPPADDERLAIDDGSER